MTPDDSMKAKVTTPVANAAVNPSAVAPAARPRAGGGRARIRPCVLFLLLLGTMPFAPLPAAVAQAQVVPIAEYELKAALLPKLGLFVKWPASAFENSGGPLIIGILGENPFGEHLESAVRGRTIDGHPLKVQACRDIKEAARCHIVFIRGSDAKATEDALLQLAGTSVLAVSDTSGFASQGGMLNLVVEDRKVRLEVNIEAVQKAKLRIDPKLLQLAKVVKTTTPPSKP